jgi:hypothetical protein
VLPSLWRVISVTHTPKNINITPIIRTELSATIFSTSLYMIFLIRKFIIAFAIINPSVVTQEVIPNAQNNVVLINNASKAAIVSGVIRTEIIITAVKIFNILFILFTS